MKLHQKVKVIREEKKISQSYIAYELGLDQSQYSRREKGEIQFIPDEIIKLAQLLETTVSDLFGEKNIISSSHIQYDPITQNLIQQYELRLKEKDEIIKLLHQKEKF